MERVQPIGRERLPPLVTNWRIDRSIAPRAEGSRRGCSLKGSQAGGRSPTIGLLSSRKVSFTAVTAVRQQQPTLRRPHGAEGPCSDPLAASRSNRIPPSPFSLRGLPQILHRRITRRRPIPRCTPRARSQPTQPRWLVLSDSAMSRSRRCPMSPSMMPAPGHPRIVRWSACPVALTPASGSWARSVRVGPACATCSPATSCAVSARVVVHSASVGR